MAPLQAVGMVVSRFVAMFSHHRLLQPWYKLGQLLSKLASPYDLGFVGTKSCWVMEASTQISKEHACHWLGWLLIY